ncbi:uncharacterized protein BDR25DRAFT_375639 [Lindgomyces ingoldianus]|uniref:Uncharacterized protein n=1 Tax=Lindgomyces ingoldianus TaxID=673940 RepID=A0ACB6RBH4_9PLEO|nr:uncharacterized protein BDR25DRAFT_375639 [Lindgomyces ingoldianus]KAF2476638.1 hypothetical protein BDR25DRAFT_375639 [Lindgomyces ingoldianus]
MSTDNEAVSFSAREMQTLALAWQCMETEPKIDYTKLARLAGYTEGSAKVTLGNIKRKMKIHASGLEANSAPTTPKKPATGTGKTPKSSGKRAASGATSGESLSKRGKKVATGGAGKKGKGRVEDEEDDEEEFKAPKIKDEEVGDLERGAREFYEAAMRNNSQGYHLGIGGGDGDGINDELGE